MMYLMDDNLLLQCRTNNRSFVGNAYIWSTLYSSISCIHLLGRNELVVTTVPPAHKAAMTILLTPVKLKLPCKKILVSLFI